MINPAEYEAAVGDCIGKVTAGGVAIPVMTSGMGDLITWDPGDFGYRAILYRLESVRGISSVAGLLLYERMGRLLSHFSAEIFPKAVAKHGEPAFDESFVFVPLLPLGGKASVNNLKKRSTIGAIQVAVEFQGLVEH